MIKKKLTTSDPVLSCIICSDKVDLRDHLSGQEIEEGFKRLYEEGLHVQSAFPTLSSGVREMFISGICNRCFEDLFTEEE